MKRVSLTDMNDFCPSSLLLKLWIDRADALQQTATTQVLFS